MFEKEYQFFLEHQKELFDKHPNKFLIIVGTELKGVFETNQEAYDEAVKSFGLGKFLIQQAVLTIPKQIFRSRVIFA